MALLSQLARLPVGSPTDALLSLIDRLLDACSRRLLRPDALRRAGRTPFLRMLARRSAGSLFDLVAGFTYSQVLLACIRLEVFERLADGARSVESLAPELGLAADRAGALLDAAVAIGLLRRRASGRYALGMLGAAVRANPGIAAMVEHNVLLYRDLEDPVALLRGAPGETDLARYWPYAASAAPGELELPGVAAYTRLMGESQTLIADELLAAYPLDDHRVLLDVGGGDGAFIRAAAAQAPWLRFILFDLPPVVQTARRAVDGGALGERVRTVGGDFLADELPRGADVATLVRVLHDQDESGARRLLRSLRAALPDDGVLVVAEPMRDTPGARRVGDVYFPLYFLAMGRGHARSPEHIAALLREAGFRRVVPRATGVPLQTSVLVAYC